MINNSSIKILVSYTQIRKQLKREYGYTEQEVIHTVWRLVNSCDEVKVAFAKWFNDDIDPNVECEGVSWYDMVKEKKLNPYNAFLFMDTIIKNPTLGINLLPGQVYRPSLKLNIEDLRPELREYVKEEIAKEEAEKAAVLPKDGDMIDLNQTTME